MIRAQPRRPCPSKDPREAKGGTLPDRLIHPLAPLAPPLGGGSPVA
jgi:hypothetical protein